MRVWTKNQVNSNIIFFLLIGTQDKCLVCEWSKIVSLCVFSYVWLSSHTIIKINVKWFHVWYDYKKSYSDAWFDKKIIAYVYIRI